MKVVFLDRDGTIIREKEFLTKLKEVKILSAAPRALQLLKAAGYKFVVYSNQSAVARGLITERELIRINQYIRNLFQRAGITFAKFYYCPHHPTAGTVARYTKVCNCRKPAPGMLLKAKRQLGIDMKQSFAIGDTLRDVAAGRAVGCRTILVRTGNGRKTLREITPTQKGRIDYIARDLLDAARWILRDNRRVNS